MIKRQAGMPAMAALALLVAAPLGAQNIRLSAVVPFEFIVGNKTLPAGEYVLRSATAPQSLQIRSDALQAGIVAMAASTTRGNAARNGEVRLVFNRYDNHYVLAQVWDGLDGVKHDLPRSRTERELARTASAAKVEVLGLVARR